MPIEDREKSTVDRLSRVTEASTQGEREEFRGKDGYVRMSDRKERGDLVAVGPLDFGLRELSYVELFAERLFRYRGDVDVDCDRSCSESCVADSEQEAGE